MTTDRNIQIGTTIGVAIGTAIGIAIGLSIGITMLGILKVDMNSQLTFWISTGMAVGGGISLVKHVLKMSGKTYE